MKTIFYTPNTSRYESEVGFKVCGKSGLKLPRVSLGLWHNFGDIDNQEEASAMIKLAFDHGITHFDLANNYGNPPGSAEKNFGEILRNNLSTYRDELIISTKAGHEMWSGPYGNWGSRKSLVASLHQSLKRIGTEYVDIFYSHRYDPETPIEETMGALSDLVKQGKALYIGISKYPEEKARKAYQILRNNGTPCLINQDRYNIFTRGVENNVIPAAAENGIGFIAFSPLAQGLLTDKYINGIPQKSRAAQAHGFLKKDDITTEKIDKIIKLNKIAAAREQSLAQMAIVWCLHKPEVTSVILGASSTKQLKENIKALNNTHFDSSELWKIGELGSF